MKNILFCIIVCALSLITTTSHAQIGYQVSLLNTATGEPRAGVTVNATVTITDSSNKVVYTGTQQATSNDFGVLSLSVGNSDTFSKADYSKLPFFIEVSVDGTLIGKSQILSVPVAEYAKKTGELTKEKLVGTWTLRSNYYEGRYMEEIYIFFANGTFNYVFINYGDVEPTQYGEYMIDGNYILLIRSGDCPSCHSDADGILYYIPSKNTLCTGYGYLLTKQ